MGNLPRQSRKPPEGALYSPWLWAGQGLGEQLGGCREFTEKMPGFSRLSPCQ